MNELEKTIVNAIRHSEWANKLTERCFDYEEHKDNRSAARMIEADEKLRAELKGAGIKIYERSSQETARGEWTVWLYRPNWNCDDADDPCRVALAGTTIRQNPHQVSIARPADGTPGPERLANMFKLS
jgi:hypothetical protein